MTVDTGVSANPRAGSTAAVLLVFGGESAGVPNNIKNLGTTVKIPFSSQVDSLNISVAAGISLFYASKFKQI